MPISEQTHHAARSVLNAALMSRRVQDQIKSQSLSKDDKSPVTVADLAVQAVISRSLLDSDPNTLIVGEENSSLLRRDDNRQIAMDVLSAVESAGYTMALGELFDLLDAGATEPGDNDSYWVLDPIDGTKGFLRGQHYALALGYVENGQVTRGILACPALEYGGRRPAMAVAESGAGTWLMTPDGARPTDQLSVNPCEELGQARFCESVEPAHSAHDWSSAIATRLGIGTAPLRIDSQCKYFALASGLAEIYLRLPVSDTYVEKVWDHAAGKIIVEEAGGVVSDINGLPLDFSHGRHLSKNRGVIVSNTALHDRVLEAVQATRS